MYGRPQVDKSVFADTFSDDSLGESTRSLLSPVYGDGGRFEPSELSEGSLSSDDEPDKESLHGSRNSERDYSLHFERSYTSDKPKTNGYTTPTAGNSTISRRQNSSRKHSSVSKSNTNHNGDNSKTADTKGNCLSPWETWLIKKTTEDRERAKQKRFEKKKQFEESEQKKREREQFLQQASEKYDEWLEMKKKAIAQERRNQKLKEQFELEQKENSKRFNLEDAAVKYNDWLGNKKAEEKKRKTQEEMKAVVKKEREVERKLHNEEAYNNWIKEVKERPKPVYNSFGYTGGILTGYYEWGSYPAPSYYNPIPWVPPKVKKNSERRKGKKEMQPASPPLLFRDIDIRKAKEKK